MKPTVKRPSSYRLRVVPTPTGQWCGRVMVGSTEIGRISPCATPEAVCIAAIKAMKASPGYITIRNGEKVIELNAGRPAFSLLRVRAVPEGQFHIARFSENEPSTVDNLIGKAMGGALAAEAPTLRADIAARPATDTPDAESR